MVKMDLKATRAAPRRRTGNDMKTKTNVVPGWLSPAQVMDTLFDVREPGCEELGYALLRPAPSRRRTAAPR